MDDFPDAAIFPRALMGEDAPERKARVAAVPVYLDWIKGASARIAGGLIHGRGRFAALGACLLGVAWLGWSHFHGRPPAPPNAEISRPAQTTAAQAAEAEAMRAAQSLDAAEAAAPETAKPPLEAAKVENRSGIVEAVGKTTPAPPKPAEKLAKGSERVDQIGLKITALLGAAPAADHSAPATPAARKQGPKARHDAFDPSLHPNAPGAPRPLVTIPSAASAKKSSAEYAYKQPAD
jgi:hypothetical protein